MSTEALHALAPDMIEFFAGRDSTAPTFLKRMAMASRFAGSRR